MLSLHLPLIHSYTSSFYLSSITRGWWVVVSSGLINHTHLSRQPTDISFTFRFFTPTFILPLPLPLLRRGSELLAIHLNNDVSRICYKLSCTSSFMRAVDSLAYSSPTWLSRHFRTALAWCTLRMCEQIAQKRLNCIE